ncbi:hypothetical protein ACFVU0_14020 [Streptomyces sp. NPDC058122]|uniref:hypothetical protein n=1 Tax=Streptomyces sp. NPDC058122 TaxID=3346349 RepID=UPI0036E43923
MTAFSEGQVGTLARFAKSTSPFSIYLKAGLPQLRFGLDLGLVLCLPSGDPGGCRGADCADRGADDATEESCKSCVHVAILVAKRRALPVGRDRCA